MPVNISRDCLIPSGIPVELVEGFLASLLHPLLALWGLLLRDGKEAVEKSLDLKKQCCLTITMPFMKRKVDAEVV